MSLRAVGNEGRLAGVPHLLCGCERRDGAAVGRFSIFSGDTGFGAEAILATVAALWSVDCSTLDR